MINGEKDELLMNVKEGARLEDFFCLAEIFLQEEDVPSLEWIVRLLHEKRPRLTERWPDRIRQAIPSVFLEIEKTFIPLMDEKKPSGVSRWRQIKFNKRLYFKPNGEESAGRILSPVLDGISYKKTSIDSANVVTFGSCFASYIYSTLIKMGVETNFFSMTEEINSPFSVMCIMEYISKNQTNVVIEEYKALGREDFFLNLDKLCETIKNATDIVITLGVSLCPTVNGQPIYTIPPSKALGIDGVRFQVIDSTDNADYIRKIVECVRILNEDIRFFLTVSPVPLVASPSGNVVVDDFRSKASIRVALDEVIKEDNELNYWPSFEMSKWYPAHMPISTFGADDGDLRHVNQWVVDYIVSSFVELAFE